MELFAWNDELSVGCLEVDQDHKKLVGILNSLIAAIKEEHGREVIGKILNDLLSYTSWHFRHEERLMQTYRFSGFMAHKKEHAELIAQAVTLQKQFDEEGKDLSDDVLEFLKKWLTHHILEVDMVMGRFLHEKIK
ncbi:MAG: hemerythrin family protein [Magnetococcales bacterium]|nr:hemerythrin family protein [Magnetococcales bacterium]NGZ04964.1 hemerythrin family protein [Magnetococcales bacterium]